MPLQSGSDRILAAMRRSYRAQRYLSILDRVRAVMPDAAITTDIIVGFPGETEADFESTLDVVRAARFASAFTFQYSVRPGTPAADMPGQVPKDVVAHRYQRLLDVVEATTLEENRKLVGQTVEVLVAVGEGRKDAVTGRISGRARDGRLVHLAPPAADGSAADGSSGQVRPGDIVVSRITYGAPHHLTCDAPLIMHRRTRAGDAWQAQQAEQAQPARQQLPPQQLGVPLGMPTIGRPA
jgi:tRNA-2-methylthio-N6-dimethylallyladenosine synthase